MSSADLPGVDLRPSAPFGAAGSSRLAGAHRRRTAAQRVRTVQRWAAAVLTLATAAVLGYVALVVAAVWLAGSAIEAVSGRGDATVDLLAVGRHVAPVLLVGWCTGMAASAGLAPGEALGPRAAGLLAGSIGALAGAAVLALATPL